MGLDMYLEKRIYIGANYEHRQITGEIKILQDGVEIPINFNKISTITEIFGYWRKANQIHNWFVENVQDGVDNCGEYYVSEENLTNLLEACKDVKAHPKQAEKILPTQRGFFFGSDEYDDYYFEDIDRTIEILEDALKCKNTQADFYYRASW